jgi:DNA-directed RNA polymerase subunit E'/Rpb7
MAAAKTSLFRPVYLDHRVTLTPTEFRDAAADVDAFLTKKIQKRLEEKCCVHGYVRRGSTQILARSMGQAEHCRFTGDFLYTCKVRVLCLLPESGQVVDAQVLDVNKSGAYALIVDGGIVTEAARVFVPRDLHIGNQEFDGLAAGSVIRIKLLLSRFQANDAFIQSVGTYEGESKVEVTVPARKGALTPAVPATEEILPSGAASLGVGVGGATLSAIPEGKEGEATEEGAASAAAGRTATVPE